MKASVVGRLFDGQAFDIGPGIPVLSLAARHVRFVKGFHAHIFGAGWLAFAKSTRAFIGKPLQGTAMDHASTQRCR